VSTYDRSELGRRRDKRIASLQADLERDRRRHRRMLDRYEELREELGELGEAIRRRERLLDALKEAAPGALRRTTRESAMTKPEIAERILFGSLEPLFPRQVRDEAVEKGWLSRGTSSHNQLSVAMSKMARKDRLVKTPDGRYCLPGRD
jgi:NTP pyrophosphatase (non-canonical NTP hydrolase)